MSSFLSGILLSVFFFFFLGRNHYTFLVYSVCCNLHSTIQLFAGGFHRTGAEKHWGSYSAGQAIFSKNSFNFQYEVIPVLKNHKKLEREPSYWIKLD